MPRAQSVHIDVSDIVLSDAEGGAVPLASLTGVHVLVLMRHRH